MRLYKILFSLTILYIVALFIIPPAFAEEYSHTVTFDNSQAYTYNISWLHELSSFPVGGDIESAQIKLRVKVWYWGWNIYEQNIDIMASDTTTFNPNVDRVCEVNPSTNPNPSQFYTVTCSLSSDDFALIENDGSIYIGTNTYGGTYYLDYATLTVTTASVQPALSVSPSYRDATSDSGSTSFSVSNSGGGTMSWTAVKDPGDIWISINSGNSGTNSGTISVSYDENTGSARVGTITITAPGADNSPQNVEIRQDAPNPYVEYRLTPSDGNELDKFGCSVSISGNYAIVGACGDDDNSSSSGSAYIYEWTGTEWGQQAKLTASDGAASDYFGYSVSISGDYAIVGAYGDDDNGYSSGSAYIFQKPVDGWTNMTETAKLIASDGAASDYFGQSLSISGDAVIVGAYQDDDNGSSSGSAYIYEWMGTEWVQQAKLNASDGAEDDDFGRSVSISGDCAIVGAEGDDDNGSYSGSAYIFQKPANGWTNMSETAKLVASAGENWDSFGRAVSIFENGAIVGAYRGDDDAPFDSGLAYIFQKPMNGWTNMTETAKLTTSDPDSEDMFGISVSIFGDHAIVGAFRDDDNGHESGAAYIFEKPAGGWSDMTETMKLTASDGDEDGYFGHSVSITSEYVIVGAIWPYGNNFRGPTYIYLNYLAADTDKDGLKNIIEDNYCTDPNIADTDSDGIIDGFEDKNQDGIVDAGETDPCNIDTDADGIQDGTENGLTLDDVGPDTNLGIFQEDLDPLTTTDPLLADTDSDTYKDGFEDANRNGRVDAGESDPDDISSLPVIQPGDVNGNKIIDLSDAVLVLQVLACIEPGQDIFKAADVNGDGKVGIEEAIYIIEIVAGVRE